ncbi:MAG: hypothetical protein EBR58_10970, partial [Betaproteobacteria bacterium]|nr:hypothetical protein [Betaproteobacteria bacterium]
AQALANGRHCSVGTYSELDDEQGCSAIDPYSRSSAGACRKAHYCCATRAQPDARAQESMVHGSRLTVFAHSPKPANEDHPPASPVRAAGSQALPQYLLRQPAA